MSGNLTRRPVVTIATFVAAMLLATVARGATYYVRTTGNDSAAGTTPATAWRTITKAAATAVANDTVYLGAGAYNGNYTFSRSGTSTQRIKFIADGGGTFTGDAGAVTISPTSGNDVITVTGSYVTLQGFTIDANGEHGVVFNGSTGAELTLCDIDDADDGVRVDGGSLTIAYCSIHGSDDDGIDLKDTNTTVIAVGSLIYNNDDKGAASEDSGNTLWLSQCRVWDNASDGIRIDQGSGIVSQCLIRGNRSDGIQVSISSSAKVAISFSTIVANSGSGVRQETGSMSIVSSIVANNPTAGLQRTGGTLTSDYNVIYGNGANLSGVTAGANDKFVDPQFVGGKDFRLLSTSPAINAADPNSGTGLVDLDNVARPQGGGYDCGCYEAPVTAVSYANFQEAYTNSKPIAWWRLNETTGAGVAVDETGNHDGKYNGPTLGLTGIPVELNNTAANFDGVNDSINVGAIDLKGTEFTALGWVKLNAHSTAETRIFAKATGAAAASHDWSLSTVPVGVETQLLFRVKVNGVTTSLTGPIGGLAVGSWSFVAAVWKNPELILYVNGVEVGRTTKAGLLASTTHETWIGDNPPTSGSSPVNATLDEMALFDYAINAQQLRAMFNAATLGLSDGTLKVPRLWGVDIVQGRLFSMENYTDPAGTTTVYGQLQYSNNGVLTNVGAEIHGLALDKSGKMFLVKDAALGAYARPVLMTLDTTTVKVGQTPVVTVVGTLGTGTLIRGLALDPLNGDLYALKSDGNLYVVNPTNGALIAHRGRVRDSADRVRNGEDLVFDALGSLLVFDNADDELYRVDKTTARIVQAITGPSASLGNFEGLANDHLNQEAVFTDNALKLFFYGPPYSYPSLTAASYSSLALDDIKAIGFVPQEGQQKTGQGVRIFKWVEIK